MNSPKIVPREEWLKSRQELLSKEKQFMLQRDELSAARRQLPWVKVEEDYLFEDSDGQHRLLDLFRDKRQLIVQHFMFGEDWDEGCPSCSLWADGFNDAVTHLGARNAHFIAVSNTQYSKIATYKKRMGWNFDWLSCLGSRFNTDYQVSFTPAQIDSGKAEYNYRESAISMDELPGISVFTKDSTGQIYHTYSSYARGLDNLNVTYQLLDLLPEGRDEDALDFTMAWVRRRDQYNSQ